jgi:hypothetical protein
MPSLNTKLATAPNVSANYVLKATTSTTIGNSAITDDGTEIVLNGLSRFTAGGFDTYISQSFGNTINFGYNVNTALDGWVNYRGFQNGTTQFRNFRIGNGKETAIATFAGSSGFIGFGTSNPSANLHVTSSSNSVIYAVGANNTFRAEMQVEGAGQFTGSFVAIPSASSTYGGIGTSCIGITTSSTPLVFATNNTERMRITSAGNVGIAGNAGTGRLQVWGESQSSSNFAMYVYNSGGFALFGIRNDGAQFLSGFTYNNTISDSPRTIYQGSGLGLGGISSVRASKKNIENIDNIDWIYQLNPVTFNYRKKDEEGNYTEENYKDLNYGLIAEDTAPIADFLINYNNKEDGSKQMVGIEYSRLITPLLKAIQELNQKLQDQQQTINSLINR